MPLLHRDRNSKKSATILRAVPENTECDTGLRSDQQDITPQACLSTNDGVPPTPVSCTTPSPSRSKSIWSRKHNSDVSVSPSTKTSPTAETKPNVSHTSLKGAVGTYRHGKIQWRRKDRNLSSGDAKNTQGTDRTSRPKIQVVIPGGRRDQPLPALPFFGDPTKMHLNSNSAKFEHAHDVSPPSASQRRMRDSVVSPLGPSQLPPIPFGQFQRTMSHNVQRPQHRKPKHYKNASESGNSSNESQESDASSLHSNRSSETSVEPDTSPRQAKTVIPPTCLPSSQSTVCDKGLPSFPRPAASSCVGKDHRFPPSSVPPRKYTHQLGNEKAVFFQPTCEIPPMRRVSSIALRKPTLSRKSSKRGGPQRLATNPSTGVVNQIFSRTVSGQLGKSPRGPSPTLSEAECDLHEQLASLTDDQTSSDVRADVQNWTPLAEDGPLRWDIRQGRNGGRNSIDTAGRPRKDSDTIGLPDAPPQLPRKSSKRQSTARTTDLTRLPREHIASQMARGRSRASKRLTLTIPEYKRLSELAPPPLPVSTKRPKPTITPSGAETVILSILRNLDHFQDLFATAIVNQGFYRVFKRHELDLIKGTLRTMSPPAWEFREIAYPGHDLLHAEDLEMTRPDEEYTPTTYLQLQKRDVQVIRTIKSQIVEKCQSFVRPEISVALMSECLAGSARVDDALWRIWTFCKIFGSGKGRDEDIMAQMDWLNGGVIVHQKTCTFSIMSTDFMNDTLIGAPECFAKGNEGGLSAEQLFDMMELWNCLGVLLQGFEGRTVQARQAGIYDNTDIRGGDIDGEEMMLDEWCYHLLTFGPATVLKLTGPYAHSDPKAFTIAAENGWVNWKPPVFGGSRRNFLKEAASRVYEDKIAHTYARLSTRDVQRQQSKMRIQKHINELHHRKNSGEYRPTIRMSQERPMSEWDTVIQNLTRPPPPGQTSPSNIVSHVPSLRSGSAFVQELSASVSELPPSRPPTDSPSRRTIAQPLLPSPPPSTVPSTRDRCSIIPNMPTAAIIDEQPPSPPPRMPSIDEHPPEISSQHPAAHPAFQQHEAQRYIYGSERYENTADKAIYRIVEMGFTPEQAREALRMTDLGVGLRIDRAVELLLSRQA
ncbi:hypothetical protein BDW02DRAFT_581967 [Decorospora gaudefroyi]|uniref:UBA domain-containing protein n=1 Tax=Decorospora gaudefroyi TaxID=184978 RepID=A0A6A5KAV3_9PLEO|nr:hypothetical protein BDW02DRAFT_581967 [Decorospora gaudefroyi]